MRRFFNRTNDALLAATYTMNSMGSGGYMPRYGIAGNNSTNLPSAGWENSGEKPQRPGALTKAGLYIQRTVVERAAFIGLPFVVPVAAGDTGGNQFLSYDCISSFEAMLAVPLNSNHESVVSASGTIAGGGTLNVTNLGPALQGGDAFQLFNQSVSGFTTMNLPVLSTGNGRTTWH